MANQIGHGGKRGDPNREYVPSSKSTAPNTDERTSQDQGQITRLEEEMTRAERGMLYWSRVVAVFTGVLAVIGCFQVFAFIESGRASLIVSDVNFSATEPTNGPNGYDLTIEIKNVGKHTATNLSMIAAPGLFIVNKELAADPVYQPEHSIVEIIPPIIPSGNLTFFAHANIPPPPAPMTPEQRLGGVLNGDIPMRVWGRIEYGIGYPSWNPGLVGFCFEYVPVSARRIAQRFKVCQKPNYTYTR